MCTIISYVVNDWSRYWPFAIGLMMCHVLGNGTLEILRFGFASGQNKTGLKLGSVKGGCTENVQYVIVKAKASFGYYIFLPSK